MLYHSIDGSRVMLSLVSNKYLSSAVCQEEYNLALAKHCSGVSKAESILNNGCYRKFALSTMDGSRTAMITFGVICACISFEDGRFSIFHDVTWDETASC